MRGSKATTVMRMMTLRANTDATPGPQRSKQEPFSEHAGKRTVHEASMDAMGMVWVWIMT